MSVIVSSNMPLIYVMLKSEGYIFI
uniref:Uncharacterized protein n=1 Tax=mine drainage metagenome TaxID=410659 RepID=E6QG30_9ZZZZ